jgi:hypothetical protein
MNWIYVGQVFVILIGVFFIGSAVIEISDEYRATHPSVRQLTYGEFTEPKFFVKGTLEIKKNNAAPAASMEWDGKAIEFKPLPETKKGERP